MATKFGTDGIRGVAGKTISCETVHYACKALAFLCKKEGAKVLVAKDNRESGSCLECAAVSGITSYGADAYLLGIMPTGGASILTRLYGADACVVVSASHNPPEYNGIKLFDNFGKKICAEYEKFIEKCIQNRCKNLKNGKFGQVFHAKHCKADYENYCKKAFSCFSNQKVVVDCSNGATIDFVKNIFSPYVKKLHIVGNCKSGDKINNFCGSTYPRNIAYYVNKYDADIGFAFDGDGDRIVCADKNRIYCGDVLLYILAKHFKQTAKLSGGGVAGTIMTNIAVENLLKNEGIRLFRADVGDKFLLSKMTENNLNLGGEDSGHIIIRSTGFSGDGILSAINLLNVLAEENASINDLAKDCVLCPQVVESIDTTGKDKFELVKKLQEFAEENKKILPKGRILIRASGTEDKIRIMVEDEDENKISQIIHNFVKVAESLTR